MPLDEYIKTWINGEIITAEKMNAISNALGNVITEMNNAKCTNIKDGEGNCSIVQNAIADTSANIASGDYSHAEGTETTAFGAMSHAEGSNTKAMGAISHAEGYYTIASGNQSHAEGRYNEASNQGSHAEGEQTISSGQSSHSEGKFTKAQGTASHAEGIGTIASYQAQHVFGSYNNITNDSNITNADRGAYLEIVGNGTDSDNRSNARTLDWEGNQSISGDLIINANTNKEANLTSQKITILDQLIKRIQMSNINDINITLCIDKLINMLEHWTGGSFGDNSNNYGQTHNLGPTIYTCTPVIIEQPKNYEARANSPSVFEISAHYVDSFQWQYSNDNGQTWNNCEERYTSPKTRRVIFTAKSEMNGWLYRVMLTNTFGITYSNSAVLTITEQEEEP